MDYIRLNHANDLKRISSIKEEEEIDIDSIKESSSHREKSEGYKLQNVFSPKKFSFEDKSIFTFDEILENINTGSFSSGSSRISKRLSFKIAATQESEFPLLVRGFDTDKNKDKEPEISRRRSLKDMFSYQGLQEENKDESSNNKIDMALSQVDSLDEDEIDENLYVKSPSMLMNDEIISAASMNSPCGENVVPIYNRNVLNKVISSEESYEISLYMALNDNAFEIPELKSSFFEKIGFSNKKKENILIETALEGLKDIDITLEESQKKNKLLKTQIESLKNETKKSRTEYLNMKTAINNILSNLNEEKYSGHIRSKNIDLQLNEANKLKAELIITHRDDYKLYLKQLEEFREIQET